MRDKTNKSGSKVESKKKPRPEPAIDQLKGWAAIADFLGQTTSVAQRWHREGMPVGIEGRFVYADANKLTEWVGTEGNQIKPLHIASENEDLVGDLKQALGYVKKSGGKK